MTHQPNDVLQPKKHLETKTAQAIQSKRVSVTHVQSVHTIDPALDSIKVPPITNPSTLIAPSKVSDIANIIQVNPLQSIQDNPAIAALSMLPLEQIDHQVLQDIINKVHHNDYTVDQAFEDILHHALASSLALPQHLISDLIPHIKHQLSHYPEISEQIMHSLLHLN
jgi:hypothetical protein